MFKSCDSHCNDNYSSFVCFYPWLASSLQEFPMYRGMRLESWIERTCSEASSGIHKRFILYLFELDNFKYSIPNLVFLLIWSVIPKRTPPAPSGLKMIVYLSKIVFFRMKLDFCLPSPKSVCGAKLKRIMKSEMRVKQTLGGKFAQNLNMLKRLSSTNKSISSKHNEQVKLRWTSPWKPVSNHARIKNSSSY